MGEDLIRFYGFVQPPFAPSSSSTEFFLTTAYKALVDSVVVNIIGDCDVVAMRGESGAGKTTMLYVLASEFQKRGVRTVEVTVSTPSPHRLQALFCEAAGFLGGETLTTPSQIVQALTKDAGDAPVVLLVDDADLLPSATFRYIDLLSRLFQHGPNKLRLVFLGAPGLWSGLEQLDLSELRQACVSSGFLQPFKGAEATAYLDHKVRCAGKPLRKLMTRGAVSALCGDARRTPGKIAAMAEKALLHGCRTGRKRIALSDLRAALAGDQTIFWQRDWLSRIPKFVHLAAMPVVAGVTAVFYLYQSGGTVSPSPTTALGVEATSELASPPLPPNPANAYQDRPTLAVPPRSAVPDREVSSVAVGEPEAPSLSVEPAQSASLSPRASALQHADSAKAETPVNGGAPGLALIARSGDSIALLYAQVYRNQVAPSFQAFLAANREPIRPGSLVIFPEPLGGWRVGPK